MPTNYAPPPCPEYLKSSDDCVRGKCAEDCPERFKQDPQTKRWYITMGHAGYNSPANNGEGYHTRKSAIGANLHYQKTGRTRGIRSGSIRLCTKCGGIAHFATHCDGAPTRALTPAEGLEFINRGRHAFPEKKEG